MFFCARNVVLRQVQSHVKISFANGVPFPYKGDGIACAEKESETNKLQSYCVTSHLFSGGATLFSMSVSRIRLFTHKFAYFRQQYRRVNSIHVGPTCVSSPDHFVFANNNASPSLALWMAPNALRECQHKIRCGWLVFDSITNCSRCRAQNCRASRRLSECRQV